ncbi:MAG: hypothetical protein WDN23_09415 [Edaphobacter sp.]
MRQLSGRLVFCGVVVFVALLNVEWVKAQSATGPAAKDIVARMLEKNEERRAALEHYTSERRYSVEYKGTGGEHRGEIVVQAEYAAPDQKRLTIVSQSGSKVICEKVLRRLVESEQEAGQKANRMQTMLSEENYNVELAGEEVVNGTRAWVLKVSPKVENKFTYKGQVWVSEEDYATVRVQGEPAKSPSWWINRASFDSRYVRRGEFWLPGKNVSTSHVRIGGEATLTIDYGEYPVVTARTALSKVDKTGVGGEMTAGDVGTRVR